MKETFYFVPPGAVPSPDESLEITLETKHYNWVFAVILAHSIGYLDPLKARLRDTDLKKTYDELAFAAKVWAEMIKLPGGGLRQVKKNRSRLCMAAHYLEFASGEPGKGQKAAAVDHAAKESPKKLVAMELIAKPRDILDRSEVRRAVRFAKGINYGRWRWWDIASKMAHERKIEQLHRTY
jgi:hypothetical protein